MANKSEYIYLSHQNPPIPSEYFTETKTETWEEYLKNIMHKHTICQKNKDKMKKIKDTKQHEKTKYHH